MNILLFILIGVILGGIWAALILYWISKNK